MNSDDGWTGKSLHAALANTVVEISMIIVRTLSPRTCCHDPISSLSSFSLSGIECVSI